MKSVLVVDDDPAILTATSDAFECGGYDVLSVSSGEEALRVLHERDDVGLVLIDVQMPGLTGPEVIAIATGDSQLQRIPFVLMTAALHIESPRGVLLLRKPFALLDLLCLAVAHLGGPCPKHPKSQTSDCIACAESPNRSEPPRLYRPAGAM